MKNLGRYDDDLSVPRKKDVPAASTTAPKAPGTAAPGESKLYSRSDHVHPSEVFIATYGTTTYEEIKAAYDAGKVVLCKYNQAFIPMIHADNVGIYFFGSSFNAKITQITRLKSMWASGETVLVPDDRTINGKALSADITLGAVYTATLTAAGWATSGAWKTQTVSVTGLKASYNAAPFVDVSLSGTDAAADTELAAAWLGISASAIASTAANSLTVKFPATVDTPTVNIPIRITVYD